MNIDEKLNKTICFRRKALIDFGIEKTLYFSTIFEIVLDYINELESPPLDGFFPISSREIEQLSGLKIKTQKKCREDLEKAGYIKTMVMGLPATRHFNFNLEQIKLLLKNYF